MPGCRVPNRRVERRSCWRKRVKRQRWNGPDSFDGIVHVYDRFSALTSGFVADYLDRTVPRRGERAVDLGCGTGVHTEILADRYRQVLAVDVSEPMLAAARTQRRRPGVVYWHGDFLTLDPVWDGTFDLVFSAFVFHHVHPLEDGLRLVRTLVRPGGHAVLIDVADDRPRSRLWFHRRAAGALVTDLLRCRRPVRESFELFRLSRHPAWLDHLTADRPISVGELQRRYGAVLPGADFTVLDREVAVHWQRAPTAVALPR